MIVIVDDDESVRIATRSLVRSLGLVAHTFASAEEFLQSQHSRECACVITDVQMPGLSGIDLQARLIAEGRNTPVIFMTAFANEAARIKAMEAGAICFLTKPFEGQALIKCLETALARQKVPQQP